MTTGSHSFPLPAVRVPSLFQDGMGDGLTLSDAWRDEEGTLLVASGEVLEDGLSVIYRLRDYPDRAACLFRQAPDAALVFRLKAMILAISPALEETAAWPTGLLHDESDAVVGYQMVWRPGLMPLSVVLGTESRLAAFPRIGYEWHLRVARQLAQAVRTVHEQGHVIGGLEESAVAVSPEGDILLLGCDRFQVQGWGRQFPARPGGQALRRNLMPREDLGGLSGLLARLLLLAPEQGGPGLPVSSLPTDLARLFREAAQPATEESAGVDAGDWAQAVMRFARVLETCPQHAHHRYFEGLSACPWCERLSRGEVWFGADRVEGEQAREQLPGWEALREQLSVLQGLPATETALPPFRVSPAELHFEIPGDLPVWQQWLYRLLARVLTVLCESRAEWRQRLFEGELKAREARLENARAAFRAAREDYLRHPEEASLVSHCRDLQTLCATLNASGSIILESDSDRVRRRGVMTQIRELDQRRERMLAGREERRRRYHEAARQAAQARADLLPFGIFAADD